MRSTLFAAVSVTAIAALALTGCVDNSNPSAQPSSSTNAIAKDDALAALLPADVAKSGKLTIAMNNTYAPNEFKDDNGKPIGWDVDLANAIAAKLGLQTDYFLSDNFDAILPRVTGGQSDIGVSSFTDTVEREQQVDFVNYYNAGVLWAAPAGKTVDPDNACGLTVAVQTGTYEDTDEVQAKSDACVAAGKKAINKLKFDTQDDATNAVVLGKADAMSSDSPVTLYAIKQSGGKLQAAGDTFDVAPYGIALEKGSALTSVIKAVLEALIADGTYQQILDTWGVADGAVTTVTINGASQG